MDNQISCFFNDSNTNSEMRSRAMLIVQASALNIDLIWEIFLIFFFFFKIFSRYVLRNILLFSSV